MTRSPQSASPAAGNDRERDEPISSEQTPLVVSRDALEKLVRDAMGDAWNEICADTNCHPLDITSGWRKRLFFSPGHWADLTAMRLHESLNLLSPEGGGLEGSSRADIAARSLAGDADPLDLAKLEEVARNATEGPWEYCGSERGGCSCVTVMCPDYPVAKATSGDWGDDYPSMRPVGNSLEGQFEAFMEQITYGTVAPDLAKANALHIATFDPPTVLRLIQMAKGVRS